MTFPNFLNAIYLIALRLQKPDAVKLILSTILPLGHSDQEYLVKNNQLTHEGQTECTHGLAQGPPDSGNARPAA
jgi:hypothetical protein